MGQVLPDESGSLSLALRSVLRIRDHRLPDEQPWPTTEIAGRAGAEPPKESRR